MESKRVKRSGRRRRYSLPDLKTFEGFGTGNSPIKRVVRNINYETSSKGLSSSSTHSHTLASPGKKRSAWKDDPSSNNGDTFSKIPTRFDFNALDPAAGFDDPEHADLINESQEYQAAYKRACPPLVCS
jgi:hypothetical protein